MKAILLFTRLPIPGSTKTRLQGYLSQEECADLHLHMLRDIAEALNRFGDAKLFVFATPTQPFDEWLTLLPARAEWIPQCEGTLGERMEHAVQITLERGAERVVLIGSDIPGIDAAYLEQAFAALDESDIVLGPTEDGGYCLIGLHSLEYEPFSIAAAWSTSNVMQATRAIVTGRGAKVKTLSAQEDIDTKEDLLRWQKRHGNGDSHTARWLRRRDYVARKAE